jgi:hypothetical protein
MSNSEYSKNHLFDHLEDLIQNSKEDQLTISNQVSISDRTIAIPDAVYSDLRVMLRDVLNIPENVKDCNIQRCPTGT